MHNTLLGLYDRCTPALAAEASLLVAMLGSLDEARDVLAGAVWHVSMAYFPVKVQF